MLVISKSLFAKATKASLRLSHTNRLPFSVRCWPLVRKGSKHTTQNLQRSSSTRSWLNVAGGVGLGLFTSTFASPILCESITPSSRPASPTVTTEHERMGDPINSLPPPSAVNLYQLSFGIVAGVCAGVFIKKGAKVVAFFVGGVFVLLQYFNTLSLIKIDWGRAASKFENLFYMTTDINGIKRPPSVSSLWQWLIDFLTADFQPRASFLAGLTLGLRVG